jgi:hypothetical protein
MKGEYMDIQMISELVENFLADENLNAAQNWNKKVNIFEILSLDERKHSSFLSWLFDPREAHGMGDLPIKELLKQAIGRYKSIKGKNKNWFKSLSKNRFLNSHNCIDIEAYSFTNALVFTEFKAGESESSNYDAVDICIVDQFNELAIFIENKFGAKEGQHQTEKYFEYLKKRYSRKFYCIYIYLDYYNEYDDQEKCSINNNWVIMNYDWIGSFVKTMIDQGNLNPTINKFVRDYYIFLSPDYKYDSFYSDSIEIVKKLSEEHRELLKSLFDAKGKEFFHGHIESIMDSKIQNGKKNLYCFYQKYSGLLSQMNEYSLMDLISESVQYSLDLEDEFIDYESNYVSLVNSEIASWNSEYWPICLTYFENRKNKEDVNRKIYIEIDFKYIPKSKLNKVKQIMQSKHSVKKFKPRNNIIPLETIEDELTVTEITGKLKKHYTLLNYFRV